MKQCRARLNEMCATLKTKIPEGCEVALSSIVTRNDKAELDSKLNSANKLIQDICSRNKWTYIENKAVRSLSKDKLHPDSKGMSFLARNFQDFLRCAHPSIFQQGRKQTYYRNSFPSPNRFPVPLLENVPSWLKYLIPENTTRMHYRL